MRIVLAVHHFPPKYSAGAELRAFRTARWLANNGHDIRVITIESINSGSSEEVIAEDDDYQGIKVHRLSFNISHSRDKFTWEYENPWIYNHLLDYLARIEPDIFHLISGYLLGAGAVNAAVSHQIPVVVTLTDFWFFCPRINLVQPDGTLSDAYVFDSQRCTRCKFEEQRRYLLPAKILPDFMDKLWEKSFDSSWSKFAGLQATQRKFEERNRILSKVLSQADAIVCPSQFLINALLSRDLPKEKLIYIQHGLDKSNWAPVTGKHDSGIFRIGYLGQLDKHKGVHLLIEAFKNLRTGIPLELCIYGDESSFPQYSKTLKKLSNNDKRIKFLGRYEYSQIANIFSRLGVLVIPSIWNEIGPWVMYEALETKTPVLASDIPNMSQIINHEDNGLLFECGNWKDLAVQLQRVIEDQDLRRKVIAGITPVNTLEKEMTALNQVYQRVI